jgi:phosphohistidine swiveling domain-containing protein
MTAMGDELHWDPPLPAPLCRLFQELLPHSATGWGMAAERYGLAPNAAAFGTSCCWGFYSPGIPSGADVDALDRRAAETLAQRSWRGVMQRWHDDVRPRAMGRSRALVTTDLAALDDAGLAHHVAACVEHWRANAPLHFDAAEGALAAGELLEAARGWGLDPVAVLMALAGSATATSSAERLFDRIAAGLDAAGADEVVDLDQVRAVGGDAAAALEELLVDYGWRVVNLDLTSPTLAERPAAVLTAIRAARRGWTARRRPDGSALESLRAQVPEGDRDRFDELAAEASATYGYNDDNSTVYFSLPAGILRRAVLEVGHRLVERGAAAAAADALEATSEELAALLTGGGPSGAELAERAAFRRAMAAVRPPPMLGEPVDAPAPVLGPSTRRLEEMMDAFRSVAWAAPDTSSGRAAATVGTEVVRGRAVVAIDPIDALARMEPGDVLVSLSTTATFNTIFPVAGAVAVQEGGLMSHPAVLARELGLTAVIGVPDLLARVADGDLVEVDPVAGTIRVIEGVGERPGNNS